MQPLSICIREKETCNIVIATEVSLFSWLPEKCLPVYYSTVFSLIWSMAYCQKVTVAFGKVVAQLIWNLQPNSFMKNVKNRIRISIPLSLTWQRLLTLSVMMVSGKSCQSLAVHLSSSPWYVHSMMPACMSPQWWPVIWCLPHHKWSQTRMCAGPNTVQHIVYCFAIACILRW